MCDMRVFYRGKEYFENKDKDMSEEEVKQLFEDVKNFKPVDVKGVRL